MSVRLESGVDAKGADDRSDDAVDGYSVHCLASTRVIMKEAAINSSPHQMPDGSFWKIQYRNAPTLSFSEISAVRFVTAFHC